MAKKKTNKKCAICNKTITSFLDSYSISLFSSADICSKCGDKIDTHIKRISAYKEHGKRVEEIDKLRYLDGYTNGIVEDIKKVVWKKVLKTDRDITIKITSAEGLPGVGIFGLTTIRQNREGNLYIDKDQDTLYEPLLYSWAGPEYEEKEHKNGKITEKEINTEAHIELLAIKSRKYYKLTVDCNSKVDANIRTLSWKKIKEPWDFIETEVIYKDVFTNTEDENRNEISDIIKEKTSFAIDFVKNLNKKYIVAVIIAIAVLLGSVGIANAVKVHQEQARIEAQRLQREEEIAESRRKEEKERQQREKDEAEKLKKNKETYEVAVKYINNGHYSTAANILKNLDYEDSAAILSYCKLQANIDSYSGDVKGFEKKLEELPEIKNIDANSDLKNANTVVKKVESIQDDINTIALFDISSYSREKFTNIENEINSISDRYRILIDNVKIEKASAALSEMETGTLIGSLMLSLENLDPSEDYHTLEPKVVLLQDQYDSLPDDDKLKIYNSAKISAVTSSINTQKEQEETARIEAERIAKEEEERRAAEAEAERQRVAQEEAEQKSKNTTNNSEYTVYRTASGKKYHRQGCYTMKGNGYAISISDAIAMGLDPCKKCNP